MNSSKDCTRFYKLVESGKKLTPAQETFIRSFLSNENGYSDDAVLEFSMSDGKSLTAEVAELLSKWHPNNASYVALYCDTHSLSDEATKSLSKWYGGELQLTSLSSVSETGAEFLSEVRNDFGGQARLMKRVLSNFPGTLRVNVKKLANPVVAILQRMEVVGDFGDGEIIFNRKYSSSNGLGARAKKTAAKETTTKKAKKKAVKKKVGNKC